MQELDNTQALVTKHVTLQDTAPPLWANTPVVGVLGPQGLGRPRLNF